MDKTGKSPKIKKNYIGKFAKIKKNIDICKSEQWYKAHDYPYRIVNQKDNSWICLESKAFITYSSNIKTIFEEQDKSFWMKVNECEIIEK